MTGWLSPRCLIWDMFGQGMHGGGKFNIERHPSGDGFELKGIELFRGCGRPAWASKRRAVNKRGLGEVRIT